jgi:DNA mismatch repair protein MutL
MKARPAASFVAAMHGDGGAHAVSSLTIDVSPLPDADSASPQTKQAQSISELPQSEPHPSREDAESFMLREREVPPQPGRLEFTGNSIPIAATFSPSRAPQTFGSNLPVPASHASIGDVPGVDDTVQPSLHSIGNLRPLGQLRDSFILAVNEEGLWIIDQHVAHERILFEKILREREAEKVQRQQLLMPLLVELLPAQMVAFAEIAEELERNGFEAEPFGPRTLAIKAVPLGLAGQELEQMLEEVLSAPDREQADNNEIRRARIAASIACHAAIKVNMPLETSKMAWLLEELAKTEHPTGCPHGRPIVLRYSLRDIERAFHRT